MERGWQHCASGEAHKCIFSVVVFLILLRYETKDGETRVQKSAPMHSRAFHCPIIYVQRFDELQATVNYMH